MDGTDDVLKCVSYKKSTWTRYLCMLYRICTCFCGVLSPLTLRDPNFIEDIIADKYYQEYHEVRPYPSDATEKGKEKKGEEKKKESSSN